ncbi:hypothetical protein [Cyclobacterium qasimii]|uniref:Uncharacterized protein n=2 Tax=Cyclobacterium qasimii TaxID=1350429 RepID=S7WQK4_9BACT|nr:hypothetical protein [Cyclobacterium qasimii]EPR69029.1 hypothetical protein ADICYQ_1938 [Cyclobacterium qasimii M12-11B]GEO24194.1 hypothetical protein CQA01_47280 [Cyclobacterium qasimii]
MDYKEVSRQFANTGQLSFQDKSGTSFELIKADLWKPEMEGVFLVHEIYQLKSLVGNFSDVALDIVEYAADQTIFLSPQPTWNLNKGKSGGLIKFALVSSAYWKQLLHQIREIVFLKWEDEVLPSAIKGTQNFPFNRKSRVMELHEDGRVKIING